MQGYKLALTQGELTPIQSKFILIGNKEVKEQQQQGQSKGKLPLTGNPGKSSDKMAVKQMMKGLKR